MSPPLKALSLAVADTGQANETLLYASATTRVYRLDGTQEGQGWICKEYLGAHAERRLKQEQDILAHLGGVPGVAHAVSGAHRAGTLVLAECGAGTLGQMLRAGRCDIPTAISIASGLARTLAGLHRAGVIHRDVNPANIVLTAEGEPVLIDFDLAVVADHHLAVPADGQIVGTLGYLAPEQSGRTGRAVDQRADLYALGAVLYEMATGRMPFDAQDPLQLIHDHLVSEPEPPSRIDARVPAGLSDIVVRLLAKAPEQRYQSAEGLLHDLQRLQGELAEGRAGLFPLGERDFPVRLAAPEQLVGRESERAALQAAWTEAMRSPRRTVLVEGAPGVGKSALVHELKPMVAAAGGWFVQGKFDQYQKDGATAEALSHALGALGRLLLAQPRDELSSHRRRIMEALGLRAGLVAQMSPELALLLGAQPDVPEVDPRQAESRLQQAVVDLLGAIASPERPLVVVMDDLQWASALSLRVFERLMLDAAPRGLLLVGAFRAEELDEGHALRPLLDRWSLHPQGPVRIALANLAPAGVAELLGRMLRLPTDDAAALGAAIGALTAGNPFDTVEMINALRREGVLRLAEQGWQWEEAAIRRFVGRGNVVDLLAARIARLPQASRELLAYMSCLGNAVEAALLGAAAGLDGALLRDRLRAPIEDGLLVHESGPGGESFRFRHDRVQQAVLGAMDEAVRTERQLDMARRLSREAAFENDAAQQYLACVDRLADAEERRRAARLFHALARKLAGTATYQLAERYLAAAALLLGRLGDGGDAAIRGEIDAARHAALYSLGRLEESDALYEDMQARTADALELVEPACLQMRSLDMRGRMEAARQLGRQLLAQLGLRVPEGYEDPDMERRLASLHEWVARDGALDPAKRTQITDRHTLAVAKLLGRMVRSSYYLEDMKAFAWLLLESQRMWTESGPCPDLVANLCRMSSMLIRLRGDYRCGFEVVRHVLGVGEALGYEPHTSEARYMFAGNASPWFEPLENAFQHARRAYEGVKAGGDGSYAGYVHINVITTTLEIAPTLDSSAAVVDEGIALCQRTGNLHASVLHASQGQFVRALRGQTQPGSFDDDQFEEKAYLEKVGHLPYVAHSYFEFRALHAALMNDAARLARHTARGLSMAATLAGYYTSMRAYLLVALARAWQLRGEPPAADPAPLLAELESCRQWFAQRAADEPYNFLHLLHLVEAEHAWTLGDMWGAARAFNAAVMEADSRQRPWHRALITERAGLFHLQRGLEHTGRKLLADAREHYESWGAAAKVAQMQREHAFLQARSAHEGSGSVLARSLRGSNSVSPDALDLLGVLRASQALSSETSLERLVSRVTEVLAGLSGATKVLVLTWLGEQWWLLGSQPGEAPISLPEAAGRGLLPASAVGYAERTAEALVVDDAVTDDRFARDPYFAGVAFCSLLVAPIASQGTTRAMLLLENRQGRAAFNGERLDAVMLIAGQLAVSLANAQLYESLEERVAARTRELEQTQAQLVATARRAGRAEIANNVLHNVGNVLNSINVSASIVSRTIGNSRIEGLARAVGLMNEHQADLARFMGQDPRGKTLLGYLNELVGTLKAERQEALSDLERLARSVEHITYVVATQQSHAGPSSVQETALPGEVVEEALRLSAEVLQRHAVAVKRRYEDVAAMALDKQRLLQILVNLIGNAAQAMEGVGEERRVLTLGVQAAQGEEGRQLRISVKDEGEGIAAENLTRIFAHGFTTKAKGHGFGLHSSALAAMEMGAKLTAHSDGPGLGAVFTVELPTGPTQGQR